MQRVLELSKQETGGRNNSYQPPSFSSNANNSASSSSAAQHTSSSHAHGSSSSAAAARKEVSPLVPEVPALEQATRVRALYDYTPTNPTELALQAGDVIKVIGRTYDQWWRGTLRGRVG
jgi:signal transducing adaptor molecule